MNHGILTEERQSYREPGCICDLSQHASWCTAARAGTAAASLDDWVKDSSCADAEGFHELSFQEQRVICAECPVLRQCLEYAVRTNPVTESVWAGADRYQLSSIRSGGAMRKNKHLQDLARIAHRQEIATA